MKLEKLDRSNWLPRARQLLLACAATVVIAASATQLISEKMKAPLASITVYHPFRAYFPMDPRKIYSVGDQVLSEHIFGFHSAQSLKAGFKDVLSEVRFDRTRQQVRIRPKQPILRSDRSEMPLSEVCDAVRSSFEGTQHAPYRSLFRSAQCVDGEVVISLTKIPVNLPFLFTLPDFSLYDRTGLPITENGKTPTSGPYSLEKVDQNGAHLRLNPAYPARLRANEVQEVTLRNYGYGPADFLQRADPDADHLIYMIGANTSPEDLGALTAHGYNLEYYPSEWLLFLGFNEKLDSSKRAYLFSQADAARDHFLQGLTGVTAAYSMVPADRPFALSSADYSGILPRKFERPQTALTLGVLESDIQKPTVSRLVTLLKQNIPGIVVKSFRSSEYPLMARNSDFFVDLIGISPADPLNHLAFLANYDKNFAQVATESRITQIAQIDDSEEFNSAIKKLEREILEARLLIPIAHFPGIVAESSRLERDEELAWSWGTQAWTYRVR
jgi:hypothetical protein